MTANCVTDECDGVDRGGRHRRGSAERVGIDRAIAPDVDRGRIREIVAEIEENLPTDLRAVYDALKTLTLKTLTGEASLRLR
jgi:hypothetical protein